MQHARRLPGDAADAGAAGTDTTADASTAASRLQRLFEQHLGERIGGDAQEDYAAVTAVTAGLEAAEPPSSHAELRDAVESALIVAENSPRLATWFDKKAVKHFGKKHKRFVELNTLGAEIR